MSVEERLSLLKKLKGKDVKLESRESEEKNRRLIYIA